MAQKRMFSKKITDSGDFLSMPLSAQALYFHLNLHADDDGILDNVRQIARLIGANDDDIKILLAKSYLLVVEEEVVVVRDWWVHNTILRDRYDKSLYKEQLDTIYSVDKNKRYSNNDNKMLTNSYQDVNPDKIRIDKNRLDKDNVCDIQPSNNIYTEPLKYSDDEKVDNVAEALLRYIPSANTIWLEKIELYRSKHLSDDLIIKAIENTALANTRDCRYFMAICDEYLTKGYKTAAEVDDAKKSFKNKRGSPKQQPMSREEYNAWVTKKYEET